jgi:hypothetical protein
MEYRIITKLTGTSGTEHYFDMPSGQRVVSVLGSRKLRQSDAYELTLLVETDTRHLPPVELR